MGQEIVYLYSEVDLLRYTQITTKNVVIRAPATPDMIHSAEANNIGKLASNQGQTVLAPMFAAIPPRNPNIAKVASIFILSLIRFTLLLTVKSSRF